MKVAMVSTLPPERCGIADYTAQYCKAIEKEGTVSITPIRIEKGKGPLYYVGLAMQVNRYDVVHVQYDLSFFGKLPVAPLYGVYSPLFYLLLRKPVVTTLHEVMSPDKYHGALRVLYLYYGLVYNMMRGTRLVHTFDALKRLSGYGVSATVFPFPVFNQPNILPCDEAKQKLGLAGKRVMLMFGFLNETKGHIEAVKALSGMPADVVLLVVGEARNPVEAEYADHLKSTVAEYGLLDRVVFYGYATDDCVDIVFSASDVVLLPYRDLVQSATLHQALPYGKPIVATNLGGIKEIGEKGAICTYTDMDLGLREAALEMINDTPSRQSILRAAHAYMSTVYVDRLVPVLTSLYRGLAK